MIRVQKNFRIGETVRLNSGSPDLKVVGAGKHITVEWFNGTTVERCTLPSVCFKAQ
jgi:uncharacterized protein YodC (DUF2158 family)